MTSFLSDTAAPFSSSSPSPDRASMMDTDSPLDPSSSNPALPHSTNGSISSSLPAPSAKQPAASAASPLSSSSSAASPLSGLSGDTIDTGIAGTTIPTAPTGRDDYAKAEEATGILTFPVIWNDGSAEHNERLTMLKNIFSAQLPKMPREYIVRLVFDRNHRSMCLCKKKADGTVKVVGGICFRPFHSQSFCAITATEQVKGYGTRLMNHLKEHVKTEDIHYFLTYADNYAIGYFKKQGFSKQISQPRDRWFGFIKDYDGGTLMECHIHHNMNYLQLADIIHQQRRVVYDQIKLISRSHIVHPGIAHWGSYWDGTKTGGEEVSAAPATIPPLDPLDVPGVKETGYVPSLLPAASTTGASASGVPSELSAKLHLVLKHIKQQKDAWPFVAPVDAKLVPDYYVHIAHPMDLQTMQSKLDRFEYRDKESFHSDFKTMVANCKSYNTPDTTYYRCAETLDKTFDRKWEQQFRQK